MKLKTFEKTQYITKTAVLSALAALVMLLEIPLWFAPSFYKLDLSEIVALIGGFSMGPLAGVLIELFKNLLKLLIKGSSTAFVGELANFLTGCAFVVPAAVIYRLHGKKTKKKALLGLLAGSLSLIVIGAVFNYYVLIPFYATFYKMPMDAIVDMGHAVNGAITNLGTLIVFATVPFNAFKAVICSFVTMFIYPYLSPILKKDIGKRPVVRTDEVK